MTTTINTKPVHTSSSMIAAKESKLTIIVPAYNEAESLADTIASLKNQTLPPEEIIVVDDCSTDNTGEIARACGVTVIRPPTNTGSKAGAQNFALQFVETEFTMAVDADTVLDTNAIEYLLAALEKQNVVAACGFVLPRHVRSIWERGRYIEYLLAFTWYKPIQDFYDKPLISSGCFSAYRTIPLRKVGGWSTRTLAEDMDLTWTFYHHGYEVRFIPKAVCYPIEPHNLNFMQKQLRRWSHGFIQNVALHWRENLRIPYLRQTVNVALWDATIASLVYLILIPILTIVFAQPLFLLAYVIDLPAIVIPALISSIERKNLGRIITSIPSFFILRLLNGYYILQAVWLEWVRHKPLKVYEKGH